MWNYIRLRKIVENHVSNPYINVAILWSMQAKTTMLATLIPTPMLVAPNVFASHQTNNCCTYSSNGSGSVFEHGLHDGTIMARRGDAAPGYDDHIGTRKKSGYLWEPSERLLQRIDTGVH